MTGTSLHSWAMVVIEEGVQILTSSTLDACYQVASGSGRLCIRFASQVAIKSCNYGTSVVNPV